MSDLRAEDWQEDGEALTKAIRELNEAGVKVHLIDVAMPGAADRQEQAAGVQR